MSQFYGQYFIVKIYLVLVVRNILHIYGRCLEHFYTSTETLQLDISLTLHLYYQRLHETLHSPVFTGLRSLLLCQDL